MSADLGGKRVLVTGGSRGIGYAVAHAFVTAGADVTVLAEREEVFDAARRLTAEHGREVRALHCDVTDRVRLRNAVRALGSLDVLVANAGTGDITSLTGDDETDELFDRIVQINLVGAFNTVRAVLPILRDGGRIIFTSSVHGQAIAPPNMSAYAASKGGLESLVRSLARELGPRCINVNAVAPGMVLTELTLGAIRKLFRAQIADGETGIDEAAMIRQLNASQAIHGTPVDPDRLAHFYVFLASPAGAEITGQSINVDHGMAMK